MTIYANIIDIIKGTTVDGPGFRTSIYFAGCYHNCEGCHNPQSWDFNTGSQYSIDQLIDIILEEDFDVTLSGGDPLYHPEFVETLVGKIKELNYTVWIYTGFTWEEIVTDNKLLKAISGADVVVDSPYIHSLRDTDLLFRGSSNQRLIDIKASLSAGRMILWDRK